MSSAVQKIERLVRGFERPERIYVSIHDHRALYLHFSALWEVRPIPYGQCRDQMRWEGIPIEWVPRYSGPPTTVKPNVGECQ